MSERLTDAQLAALEHFYEHVYPDKQVRWMIDELRTLRQQALTGDDLAILRWLRDRWAEDENVCGAQEWRERHPKALAVIDRLLGGAP